MVLPRPQSLWFPDVPAWPSSGTTPAADLAAHLARFRSVDAAQGDVGGTAVAVLDAPALPVEPSAPRFETPVAEIPGKPSSDLDAFLAEAEKSVRAKRKTMSGRAPGWRRFLGSGPRIAGAAAAILVIVVTVVVSISLAGGGSDRPGVTADATASTAPTEVPSTSGVVGHPACAQRPIGSGTTVSNDDETGDQESGPGAIRAFNHAYYVLRSAKAARAVAAPGAVASEYVMQQYIDQRPIGTRHCLKITERAPGEYSVVLTELQPDAAPITYRQVIRTSTTGGQTFIQSIKSVE
ncbi:hypothetical protein C5O27_02305 [Gordonia alkanivorans]|uniref:hypothetical protein n=1 Tax=Gordonia alkanivorans TaxID=84096 RepID=UPI000FDD25C9|nr:hypothetical protein [Gordonia alkanivorans]AZZ80072.1 hypothetical protein C5O27_02305 [Gordonia alkanivorans]